MVIKEEKNIPIKGFHGRPVVADVVYSEGGGKKPVVLFCHGYKGFKDWGAWNLMAREFAKNGFFFVKFNFAFNGGTIDEPLDFPDLEAFGENTFTKELDDLETMLDWICGAGFEFKSYADTEDLGLIGHSRGGGIAIIKAAEDDRVKKLITLASVSDFGTRFPKGMELQTWKQKGIAYVENSRTKQMMPHLYEFYANFKEHEERLTISRAAGELKIPFLIVHGSQDPTVDVENARHLEKWVPQSQLLLLEGSNHVFEASHPWDEEKLPLNLQNLIDRSVLFLKEDH